MSKDEQIKSALDYITILAWDESRYSTELKALAADYERLKRERDEPQQRCWKLEAEQPFDYDFIG